MRAFIRPALLLLLILTALTGVLYPIAMTGASALLLPRQASGSLAVNDTGTTVGSVLIAQPFTGLGHFHSRASAAAADASVSSGTNLGPTNPVLAESLTVRATRARAEAPERRESGVPADILTASGSGLDPHLSPEAARWQGARVARVRSLPESRIDSLIAAHTEGRLWGLFGEPRVNVLLLNMALDSLAGHAPEVR